MALARAETEAVRAGRRLSNRARGGWTFGQAVRIVAGTNVLVSALLAPGGGPGALLA